MNALPRFAPLALLLLAAPLSAQTPGAKPLQPVEPGAPLLNPSQKRVPPEFAPPAPPPTFKTTEVTVPSFVLSPGSQQPVEPPKPPAPSAVSALSDADLHQVIPLLEEHFVSPSALSAPELERATVQGLLDRLGSGVALLPASSPAKAEESPLRSEILEKTIGYVRLGSLSAANLEKLDAALAGFAAKGATATVLDLRATPGGATFDLAAEVCRRFCPKGKVLFTVHRPKAKDQTFTSKDDPKPHGVLVVLTDADTAGHGEIIAGVLHALADAMVIGERTRGEAAEFAEFPLSGTRVLRIAVAYVLLPDNTQLLATGIKPDLPVEIPAEATVEVLQAELEKGVDPFVFESERPRMNEAALVAGTNPELDALVGASRNRGEKNKAPLRDIVLQHALDFITTISIYEKGSAAGK